MCGWLYQNGITAISPNYISCRNLSAKKSVRVLFYTNMTKGVVRCVWCDITEITHIHHRYITELSNFEFILTSMWYCHYLYVYIDRVVSESDYFCIYIDSDLYDINYFVLVGVSCSLLCVKILCNVIYIWCRNQINGFESECCVKRILFVSIIDRVVSESHYFCGLY